MDRGSTSLSLSFDPMTRRASVRSIVRAIDRCDAVLSIFAYPIRVCTVRTVERVLVREERRKIRTPRVKNVSRRNADFADEGEREESGTRLKVRPRDYVRSKRKGTKWKRNFPEVRFEVMELVVVEPRDTVSPFPLGT